MKGKPMTEYTFEIKGTVKVTLEGRDTDETYQKALEEAIKKVIEEIDQDWLDCTYSDEDMDYEDYNDMIREREMEAS